MLRVRRKWPGRFHPCLHSDYLVDTGRTSFGMREVIVGSEIVKPVFPRLNVSLLGEVNGRLVDIRLDRGNASPSIEALYTDPTAPGLATQPGFVQLGQGIRMRPIFWNDLLHLNYQASYQQFFAPSNSRFSFQRFTIDLSHYFALYRSPPPISVHRPPNGPTHSSINRFREF